VGQVAALADAIGPRYRALVLVAACGGLRWGELVGLHVKGDPTLVGKRWDGMAARPVSPARAQLRTQSVRYPLALAIGRGSPPAASTV
jgi:hypothetical protein